MWTSSKPVVSETARRMVNDRHKIARDTRAGLECHDNIRVPTVKITRRVVMTRSGGIVMRIQNGETNKIRMNRVVSAGRVVADVAVCWVERKSVSARKGSSKVLHLDVKMVRISTISSKLF